MGNHVEHNNQGGLSLAIVLLTWLFNLTAIATKQNVSFMMGITVSSLAIIHYVIQIRKNIKK